MLKQQLYMPAQQFHVIDVVSEGLLMANRLWC